MSPKILEALQNGATILYVSTPTQRVLLILSGETDWREDYQIEVSLFQLLNQQGKLKKGDAIENHDLLQGTVHPYTWN